MEYRGSGGDEQEIWERTEPSEGMEKDHEEFEGERGAIEERGSCFRVLSRIIGELEEGRLQKAVRLLEERMKELNSIVCVYSDGEEKETSSSDGGYEKDWKWDNGGWWFRAPLVKGGRVNARYRREISRMVRQMLDQEAKKGGRQTWEWENLRKEGRAESNLRASNLASSDCTTSNRGGNLSTGPGDGSQDVHRDVQHCNDVPNASRSARSQDRPSPEVFM